MTEKHSTARVGGGGEEETHVTGYTVTHEHSIREKGWGMVR